MLWVDECVYVAAAFVYLNTYIFESISNSIIRGIAYAPEHVC